MSVSPMFGQPYRHPLGPPLPPPEPRYTNPQHLLHAVLTFFSFGLWFPIWALCMWSANKHNAAVRAAYDQAYEQWRREYWAWSHGPRQ